MHVLNYAFSPPPFVEKCLTCLLWTYIQVLEFQYVCAFDNISHVKITCNITMILVQTHLMKNIWASWFWFVVWPLSFGTYIPLLVRTITWLILGLCPVNERRRYFVTRSLIGLGTTLKTALYYINTMYLWMLVNKSGMENIITTLLICTAMYTSVIE